MNFAWMTVEDLRAFHGRLSRVIESCGPLERADLHPEISLSDGETLIRCAPVLPFGTPDLAVVEPVAPAPEAYIHPEFQVTASEYTARFPITASEYTAILGKELIPADCGQVVVQEEPAPEAALRDAERVESAAVEAPVPTPIVAKAGLKEGPLSDSEKLAILDGHARGETSKDIGRRLNRKPQTIGLYINMMTRTGALDDDPAPVAPVPAAAAKPVAPVAPVDATPPVQTAPMSEFDRKMRQHLSRLPRVMDWDMACDLAMCEAFARGAKLAQVALDMGKDAQWIRHRYTLVTNKIRDDRGHVKIDDQGRLLHLLRNLCAEQGEAA